MAKIEEEYVDSRFNQMKTMVGEVDHLPEKEEEAYLRIEMMYQKFGNIVDAYQEQPHLLDPFLESLLCDLIETVQKNSSRSKVKVDAAFKLMYLLTKVRGFKIVVRYLPHEVADFEPVLALISQQTTNDVNTWQSRYMLLLWLSILVLIPFDMHRFDGDKGVEPTVLRIFNIIKMYLVTGDKPRDAAAFLGARFLTRPESEAILLSQFIEWALPHFDDQELPVQSLAGILLSLSYLFKLGKRNIISMYGPRILKSITSSNILNTSHEYIMKLIVKLVQRIGISFMKSKVAPWRYHRGKRSLLSNLKGDTVGQNIVEVEMLEDDECDAPQEVEDVIEILLMALRNDHNIVRWSAAKGTGRITDRLSREMGGEVVNSVLELFDFKETDSGWHGGCLALAELGRRGLILLHQLPDVVVVLSRALIYDELKGNYSVGAHVRDAACYVSWAFARAYDAKALKPFINEMATSLLVVAVFDREINCRRAAAAAFQENVGRQGSFPNGIDIVTVVDYQAVGLRRKAYLELSKFIAKYDIYTQPLVLHLIEFKIKHWDPEIRELAAEALYELTLIAPTELMTENVLPSLCVLITDFDLNSRHGAILSMGHIIRGLHQREAILPQTVVDSIRHLTVVVKQKKYLLGVGGEFMKHAVCVLIENSSFSQLPYHDDLELIDSWADILKETIRYVDPNIRRHALKALPIFCDEYLKENKEKRDALVKVLLSLLQNTLEASRCGALDALAVLPKSMLDSDLTSVVLMAVITLIKAHGPADIAMTEARAAAISCASGIITRLDPSFIISLMDHVKELYSSCLLMGVQDYTQGSKGDIGLVVRRAAITALKDLTLFFVNFDMKCNLTDILVGDTFCALLVHCVSQHDMMRVFSANAFVELLNSGLENIPHDTELQAIFPQPRETFRLDFNVYETFVKVLPLKTYTKSLWTGLVSSIGALSVSVAKQAQVALINYLKLVRSRDGDLFNFISLSLLDVFKSNISNDRMAIPLLTTYDVLFTSGILDAAPDEYLMEMINLAWNQIKKSADPKKIMAGVIMFCNMLRFEGCFCKILTSLSILICHRFPKVRITTSTQLHIALLTFGDIVFPDDEEGVKCEEALQLLSETDWSLPSAAHLRAIRNNLCFLLGIKPPVPVNNALH